MDIEIVHNALKKRFDKHRIVFWLDEQSELRDVFDGVEIQDVVKAVWDSPGFGLKHRMMRQEPDTLFLVYRAGPRPLDEDNWLLDLILSHDEFSADQTALWMAEIGLERSSRPLVEAHSAFFKAESRRDKLKGRLAHETQEVDLRNHLLAVCAGVDEARIDSVLQCLLQDVSEGRDSHYKNIQRSNLDTYLWQQAANYYDYNSSSPSPKDFALQLFRDRLSYALNTASTHQAPHLNRDICLFFDRWRKEPKYMQSFKDLSDSFVTDLGIDDKLRGLSLDDLRPIEIYKLADHYILKAMAREVSARRISPERVNNYRKARRYSPWYKDEFERAYDALWHGAEFLALAEAAHIVPHSFDDGIERYAKEWWKLDFHYRKFMMNATGAFKTLFKTLRGEIEGKYENGYLLPLNDNWQNQIDKAGKWGSSAHLYQRDFFNKVVKKSLKKVRTIVIISDAMRYEVGQELVTLVRELDKYDASIQPAISVLPSYTQLGMAALLPHETLAITESSSAHVEVDGIRAAGREGREKILKAHDKGFGAVRAKDFMDMGRGDVRDLIKAHDCLYVYHNVIDMVGDKRDTEEKLFDACEDTLTELVDIIKKFTANNVYYFCVTADHGFIFQNRNTRESDFLSEKAEGDEIIYSDRRFVLGRGLKNKDGLSSYSSKDLGLEGDMEVQIPKSINRLRKSGSGSRFVHGGSSLQEIVIPVITIHKTRKTDTSKVEVHVLDSVSKTISAAQHTFRIYQTEATNEKLIGRTLKLGLYGDNGELLSNEEERIFDSVSDVAQDRETRVTLLLTLEADNYSGNAITLKLQERIDDTSQFRDYHSVDFKLNRHMGRDF